MNINKIKAAHRSTKPLWRRTAALLLLFLLSIIFLCAGILLFIRIGLTDDQLGRIIVNKIQAASGKSITYSSIKINWLSLGSAKIVVDNLVFSDSRSSLPILKIEQTNLEVSLFQIFQRILISDRLVIRNPVFYLDSGGSSKGFRIGFEEFPLYPIIRKLQLSGGQIIFREFEQGTECKTILSQNIHIEASNLSPAGADNLLLKLHLFNEQNTGWVEIRGKLDAISSKVSEWTFDLDVKMSSCPIVPIRGLLSVLNLDLPLSKGTIDAVLQAKGTAVNLSAQGQFNLSDAVLSPGLMFADKIPIDKASTGFFLQKTNDTIALDVSELSLAGINLSFHAKVENISGPSPFLTFSVNKAGLDLKRIFPFIPINFLKMEDRDQLIEAGLTGNLLITNGEWRGSLKGPAREWLRNGSYSIDAYLDRISGFVPGLGLPITDATGRIRLSGDEAFFKGISFTLGNSPIVLNGWITDLKGSPKSDLFLSMNARGQDLKPLFENKQLFGGLERWLDWVAEPQGGISITLDLKGALNRPALKGRIVLEDFQCKLPGFSLPLKRFNGSIRFRNSGINLSAIKGFVGESPIEVNGDIAPEVINIKAESKLNSIDLRKLNFLPTQFNVSGNIPISIDVKGNLTESKFSFFADLKGNSLEVGSWIRKKPGVPLAVDVSGVRKNESILVDEAYLLLGETRIAGKATISNGKMSAFINLPPKGIQTSSLIPYADSFWELQPGGRIEGDAVVRVNWDHLNEAQLESNLVLNHVSLRLPGLYKRAEGLTGQIRKRGKTINITLDRAKVGNSTLTGSLYLSDLDNPRLELLLDFSFLDTTDFTAPPGYVSNVTWGEWINTNPVIKLLARSKGTATLKATKGKTALRTFSEFKAFFEGNGGVIRVPNWQMHFAEGVLKGTAVFDIRENTTKPLVLNFQGDQLKLQRIITDPDRLRIEGDVTAAGHLEWKTSSKRENHGVYKTGNIEVRVYDGVIHRFEILSKIFSLINLGSLVQGRLPDIVTQGIPFRRLTWSMEVFDSKWKIKDLKLLSDAAQIDSSGMYFAGQERVDFKVGVAPLVGLDTLMSGLFGNLITKDGKTLTTTFRVRGLYASPDVRLEPFESVRPEE